jgi:hypothetical protein
MAPIMMMTKISENIIKKQMSNNLCDIVVYRQAPPIVRNDGIVLNNFSGLGHYIEMVPAVVNNTGVFYSKDAANNQSSSPQNQDNLKVAFGEW